MDNLGAGDLRIEARESGPTSPIVLVWMGKSSDRQPGNVLGPYFDAALRTCASRRVPLELRFEKLEHFNSSTITAIIQLIQDARQRGVKLVLCYAAGLRWQKLSFDALRVFARDGLLELRAN